MKDTNYRFHTPFGTHDKVFQTESEAWDYLVGCDDNSKSHMQKQAADGEWLSWDSWLLTWVLCD